MWKGSWEAGGAAVRHASGPSALTYIQWFAVSPIQSCKTSNDLQAFSKVLFENTFTQIGLDWSFEVITGGWGQPDMQSENIAGQKVVRIVCIFSESGVISVSTI